MYFLAKTQRRQGFKKIFLLIQFRMGIISCIINRLRLTASNLVINQYRSVTDITPDFISHLFSYLAFFASLRLGERNNVPEYRKFMSVYAHVNLC